MSTVMEAFNASQAESLSDLRDPFTAKNLTDIWMHIGYSYSKHGIAFTARVKFRNGPTQAEHSIDADDFPGLVRKVEAFTQSLP